VKIARRRRTRAIVLTRAVIAFAVLTQTWLWALHFTIPLARAGGNAPAEAVVICTALGIVRVDGGALLPDSPADPAADERCEICAALAGALLLSCPGEASALHEHVLTLLTGGFPPPGTSGVCPAGFKSRGPPLL